MAGPADDGRNDVIIIGSGGGGGTLAHRLAPSAFRRPGRSATTRCPALRRADVTLLRNARALDDIARHAVDFWPTTEDLAEPANRVTVDAGGRITLDHAPNNQVPKRKLQQKLHAMPTEIGPQSQHRVARDLCTRNDIPIAGCAHQAGTCRFGDDPRTSVLDRRRRQVDRAGTASH